MSQFDNQGNQDLSGKIAANNVNQIGNESGAHGLVNSITNKHDQSLIESQRKAQSIVDKAKEGLHIEEDKSTTVDGKDKK
jgi:hypothetical protein